MPQVTVVTPLHNKAPYIEATVASVIAQSFGDWEMIVVENGSTDGGPAIVEATNDDRVRLVRSMRIGPGAARNFGISEAKGTWIQFLDADDLLDCKHLENMLAAAEQNLDAEIIAGHWIEFDASNPDKRKRRWPAGLGQDKRALADSAIAITPWAIHAAIVRRSLLTRDLLWPEHLDHLLGEDTTFWFKLVTRGRVDYTRSAGALYRYHTEGCRTKNDRIVPWYQGLNAGIQTNLDFLHHQGLSPNAAQCESLMRVYSELFIQAQQQNAKEIAERSLQQAKQWLSVMLNQADAISWAIRFRRLLGLRLFLKLQSNISKIATNKQ